MVVYLNAQSKLVLFVFHRISQLPGKLEDPLVTWLLKVVPVVRRTLIQEMVLISVDLTDRIGSQETLLNINIPQSKHWKKQALQHNKNFVLQELEYFDCICYFVVDPMHNLHLGTAKHMMKNVGLNEKSDFISDEDFQRIQELVDSMTVPQDIGCIPGKISCSFSGFTADQWKNWTKVYSLFALKGVLPDQHLGCWHYFVLACKSLGKRVLTVDDIELGDRYLMQFCKAFEQLYGKDLVTPNMHLHGHLKECLLDYGPFHAFWCFTFERFNGILGSYHTNNRSVEIQLMRRFLMQAKVKDLKYPDMYPDSFMEFFGNCQSSGSVKVTQDPLEQYLSLQEHREAPVNDLNCCDWTANGCIYPVSAIKDGTLESEDLHALKSVYQELLGLDERSSIEMPFTVSEFKAIKLGSVLSTLWINAKSDYKEFFCSG